MNDTNTIDAKVNDSKVIVALDYDNAIDTLALVHQLDAMQCKLKIGKELFTAEGPSLVEKLIAKDFKVFLDLKFHDIPNTVEKACKAASDLGVWMLNVHASGGSAMMEAALAGINQSNHNPYLIAVTVLTSMNQTTLSEISIQTPLEEQVLRLATLTQNAGLHGVVCSAQEAILLRQHVSPDFLLVTPGIRPANASKDDQSRIVSPPAALTQGASYLVIGRPITKAAKPQQALEAILQSIQ